MQGEPVCLSPAGRSAFVAAAFGARQATGTQIGTGLARSIVGSVNRRVHSGVAGGVAAAVPRAAPPVGSAGTAVEATAAAASAAEDAELVRLCSEERDERAFERLFLRHRGSVTALVHRMLGPSPELEDLVQDVFVQVLRTLGTFREEARFSTWLYRVALNVVLMHRRARARRPRLVAEELAQPALDSAPSAHATLETQRRVRAFYALLEQLSEKKRTVFVLHELEGLSPARIAELVQAPVLTVRTRLFYARRELAKLVAAEPTLAHELSLATGQPEGEEAQ